MTTYRYPVLLWRDFGGLFTAAPVEDLGFDLDPDDDLAAIAGNAGGALKQLGEYLDWQARELGWLPEPQVQEIGRKEYVIHAHATHSEGRRAFPADRNVRIKVHCVVGRLDDQLRLASLPQFGLRLYHFEGEPVRDLVISRLEQSWKGQSPRALSRQLPPRLFFVDEVVVKLAATGSKWHRGTEQPRELEQVALALDGKRSRLHFGPAWEREPEVVDLCDRLGEQKANVILCGEPGAGKTTALAEAVRRLTRQQEQREPQRYWLTSGAKLIAGMMYLGQWEARCQRVIAELQQVDGVLCVENLLDLVRLGGAGPGDSVAAFLATSLREGELRMVAEASPEELEACRRQLPGLVDLFQILSLAPLDRAKAVSILDRVAEQRTATERGLSIARGVSDQVERLYRRFRPYGAFPGRAARFVVDLLDEAAARGGGEVSRDQAIGLFVRRTGLPEVFLRDELTLTTAEVEAALAAEVLGQDEACRVTAEVVTAFKAGLNDPERPVGVLLLCGPTGVGKTQLARSLARFCFGHGEEGDRLLRLDMSEYGSFDAASRLLGEAEHGGSEVIRKVRQQPFRVVLFDEIEKAAPEVFDVLLNLLDEGRLTDALGRLTDFRSTIILMTSNLGARSHDPVGFADAGAATAAHVEELTRFFRPEFVNRLDEVISFAPLALETVRAIAIKELEELLTREGLERRRLTLRWTEGVVDALVAEGFSARYGARNLQRVIERRVVIPLSHFLLDTPELGDRTLELDLDDADQVAITVR